MTIFKRPVTPRSSANMPVGAVVQQNPNMPKPDVPDGVPVTYDFVPSVLLPLAVANADLRIVVKYWRQVSADLFISPVWNDVVQTGVSQKVTASEAIDPASSWTFSIPAAQLVTHGRFPVGYVTSTLEDGAVNESFSSVEYVLVDRVAPGGEVMPTLQFHLTGGGTVITEADLNASGELETFAADYYDMKVGDLVTPWIGLADGTGEYLDAQAETVDVGEVATQQVHLFFPRALLEKYGDGPVAFSYKLKDFAGNETADHAPLEVREVLLESAPGARLPPIVPANADGLITDVDARVPVLIQIPRYDNALAGDEITVHWGSTNLGTVALAPGEESSDPMKEIPITYAEILAQSPGASSGPVSVDVSYTVKRGATVFPTSGTTPVRVDLSIPGGPDPDPETPENENLKMPDVRSASSTADPATWNVIPPGDYGRDITIIIPWQTEDTAQLFRVNDTLRAYWGEIATPVLNTLITTVPTADTAYTITAGVIAPDPLGNRPVWYTVTRALSTNPHITTAKSKVQTVLVQSNIGSPGDGNPLARPDFPEAVRAGSIYYIDRARGLDGTPVRCPLTDTNIAAGDLIRLTFTGYSTLDGTGTPVTTFIAPNRQITGPEFAAGEAIIDIPTETMRRICYGSATAIYAVTNSTGGGGTASEISEVVRIYLRNGNDATCTAPSA